MDSIKKYGSTIVAFLVKNRMRATRVLIAIVILLLLFTRPLIPQDSIVEELMDWLGYFLVILCVLGRSFCSIFISGTKNEKLAQTGPFSIVRNPLYCFSFIGIVGIALQTGILAIVALLIYTFYLYCPEVVAHEEEFLTKTFGDSYLEYQQQVPRWIPKKFSFELPETIMIYPKRVLNTMADAFLFFLAFPLLEILEALHRSGVIPTLLALP